MRLQAGGHDDIPGLYPVMGGAFQGDIVLRRLVDGGGGGVFINPGPLLLGGADGGMGQAVGIHLRGGIFGIHARFHGEGELLAGGVGVEQLDIQAVMQAQGVVPAQLGGTGLFTGIQQAVLAVEAAAVLGGGRCV